MATQHTDMGFHDLDFFAASYEGTEVKNSSEFTKKSNAYGGLYNFNGQFNIKDSDKYIKYYLMQGDKIKDTKQVDIVRNGKNAVQYYNHYVYCDDYSTGENYSTSESRKYLGTYSDTDEAPAATFDIAKTKTGIVWSQVEGDKGEDGISLTRRGTWAASVQYNINDFVFYEGSTYACIVNHTSGDSFDISKWQIMAEKGIDAFTGDLSNEMDSIALTNDGKTISEGSFETTVSLYSGSTQLILTDVYAVPTSTALTCTPEKDGDIYTGKVTISINKDVDYSYATVKITAVCELGSMDFIFTLQGVNVGENAVIYSLLPSVPTITLYKNNEYSVESVSCGLIKTDGSGRSVATEIPSDYLIVYQINGEGDWVNYTLNSEISSSSFKSLNFLLMTAKGNYIFDKETINVVEDGTNSYIHRVYCDEYTVDEKGKTTSVTNYSTDSSRKYQGTYIDTTSDPVDEEGIKTKDVVWSQIEADIVEVECQQSGIITLTKDYKTIEDRDLYIPFAVYKNGTRQICSADWLYNSGKTLPEGIEFVESVDSTTTEDGFVHFLILEDTDFTDIKNGGVEIIITYNNHKYTKYYTWASSPAGEKGDKGESGITVTVAPGSLNFAPDKSGAIKDTSSTVLTFEAYQNNVGVNISRITLINKSDYISVQQISINEVILTVKKGFLFSSATDTKYIVNFEVTTHEGFTSLVSVTLNKVSEGKSLGRIAGAPSGNTLTNVMYDTGISSSGSITTETVPIVYAFVGDLVVDVGDTSNPTKADVYRYNGSEWVNVNNDINASFAAFDDVMAVADASVAQVICKRLVAQNAMINNLIAKFIKIKDDGYIRTGAFINTDGSDNDNPASGTGVLINKNGVKVRGDIVADSLTIGSNVKNIAQNYYIEEGNIDFNSYTNIGNYYVNSDMNSWSSGHTWSHAPSLPSGYLSSNGLPYGGMTIKVEWIGSNYRQQTVSFYNYSRSFVRKQVYNTSQSAVVWQDWTEEALYSDIKTTTESLVANDIAKYRQIYFYAKITTSGTSRTVTVPTAPTSWDGLTVTAGTWVTSKSSNPTSSQLLFTCTQYVTYGGTYNCTSPAVNGETVIDTSNGYIKTALIDADTLLANYAEIDALTGGTITVKSATKATNSTNVSGGTLGGMSTGSGTDIAIHSDDWKSSASTTGFGILKNGDAYFNNGVFRGKVVATDGEFQNAITTRALKTKEFTGSEGKYGIYLPDKDDGTGYAILCGYDSDGNPMADTGTGIFTILRINSINSRQGKNTVFIGANTLRYKRFLAKENPGDIISLGSSDSYATWVEKFTTIKGLTDGLAIAGLGAFTYRIESTSYTLDYVMFLKPIITDSSLTIVIYNHTTMKQLVKTSSDSAGTLDDVKINNYSLQFRPY